MEEECGLPEAYFDLVYSIYAIGWTTDLEGTLPQDCLLPEKRRDFPFQLVPPIHKCVQREGDRFVFQKSYFDGSWYTVPADFCGGGADPASDRTLSAYINALAGAGFAVERLEEEPGGSAGGGANRPKEQGCCPSPFCAQGQKALKKTSFSGKQRGKAERISF